MALSVKNNTYRYLQNVFTYWVIFRWSQMSVKRVSPWGHPWRPAGSTGRTPPSLVHSLPLPLSFDIPNQNILLLPKLIDILDKWGTTSGWHLIFNKLFSGSDVCLMSVNYSVGSAAVWCTINNSLDHVSNWLAMCTVGVWMFFRNESVPWFFWTWRSMH